MLKVQKNVFKIEYTHKKYKYIQVKKFHVTLCTIKNETNNKKLKMNAANSIY